MPFPKKFENNVLFLKQVCGRVASSDFGSIRYFLLLENSFAFTRLLTCLASDILKILLSRRVTDVTRIAELLLFHLFIYYYHLQFV